MARVHLLVAIAIAVPSPSSAAELCIEPPPSGVNRSVECGGLTYKNEWVGYTTSGTPCSNVPFIICEYTTIWTISSSATDPFQNVGPLPGPGTLYLWFLCTYSSSGFASTEFTLRATDLTVTAFTPMNNFLNAGTPVELVLTATDCTPTATVAGRIDVEAPVPVEATSWGRGKSKYR